MAYEYLSEFLVAAPLYRAEAFPSVQVRTYANSTSLYVAAPELVDRECGSCGVTKWDLVGGTYEGRVSEKNLSELEYRCRNCKATRFHVWILWARGTAGAATFVKAGQLPKLEVSIPKEFAAALGDKRSLYLKGMTLRHNNYGIGALTYFRRLIEDTTDEMLDLLQQSMEETQADKTALDKLKVARQGIRFEDKVKIAGEVIPSHLKPGGVNPFGDLYELLSIGLHDLSDDECCDIVDAMDGSLRFICTRLKAHAAEAKSYEVAAKDINAKLAKLKARARE